MVECGFYNHAFCVAEITTANNKSNCGCLPACNTITTGLLNRVYCMYRVCTVSEYNKSV